MAGPLNHADVAAAAKWLAHIDFDAGKATKAGQATLDSGLTADNALAANQWGRLDEDANTAAKMLLDSLPLNMLAQKHNGPLAD